MIRQRGSGRPAVHLVEAACKQDCYGITAAIPELPLPSDRFEWLGMAWYECRYGEVTASSTTVIRGQRTSLGLEAPGVRPRFELSDRSMRKVSRNDGSLRGGKLRDWSPVESGSHVSNAAQEFALAGLGALRALHKGHAGFDVLRERYNSRFGELGRLYRLSLVRRGWLQLSAMRESLRLVWS